MKPKHFVTPLLLVAACSSNLTLAWQPIKVPSASVAGPSFASGAKALKTVSKLAKVGDALDLFAPDGFIDNFVSPDGCTVIIGSVITDGSLYADVNLNVTTGSVEVNCH